MSAAAIRVEQISKRYRIGAKPRKAAGLARIGSAFNWLAQSLRPPHEEEIFWALRDVSFTVNQGEVVGIIGRNGAGKSTLLKILSRITEPTEGRAEISGRVGSLLEVGTGFHPELTGRENIFLNGAILGMRRAEIASKFDEIVAFAEVEKFIDTPVKHYSSGMYVRLAFAVAAHLETEILLVDEVLAVGDVGFQRKCAGKMDSIAREGRTILFISHSMPAVENLCTRGIVISSGRVTFDGDVPGAIKRHLTFGGGAIGSHGEIDLTDVDERIGSGKLLLRRFYLEDVAGKIMSAARSGDFCAFTVEYETSDGRPANDIAMSFHIDTVTGSPLTLVNTNMLNQNFSELPPKGKISFVVPRLPLAAGRYPVDLNIATNNGRTFSDFIRNAATFEVSEGDFYGTDMPGTSSAPVLLDGSWRAEPLRNQLEEGA